MLTDFSKVIASQSKTCTYASLLNLFVILFKSIQFKFVSPILALFFPPSRADKYSLISIRRSVQHLTFKFRAFLIMQRIENFCLDSIFTGKIAYLNPKLIGLNVPWTYSPPDHIRCQTDAVLMHTQILDIHIGGEHF